MQTPYDKIAELEAQLKEARVEIERLEQDCVSGLLTRSTFEKHLKGMFGQTRKNSGPIGIIMCDIDHFKLVNDKHGHRVGDKVITSVASAIRSCTRTTDVVARYGGEEFVCVLAQADLAGLAVLSERLRQAVERLEVQGSSPWVPSLPKVTISVGFSLQQDDDTSCWDVVERADKSLYRAKHLGRNRVENGLLDNEDITMIERIAFNQERRA